MEAQYPEHKDQIWNVKSISLESMAEAFKTHDSWQDLQNAESDFSKFLTTVCSEDGAISIFKLRNIGILWCEGEPIEKASELFENM